MQLIQIFLPLYDNNKKLFPKSVYDDLSDILKEKFGGVSLYRHGSVEGLWKNESGTTDHDELIIAEVMTRELDKDWWKQFKQKLEQIFTQDEILIRYIAFQKL